MDVVLDCIPTISIMKVFLLSMSVTMFDALGKYQHICML